VIEGGCGFVPRPVIICMNDQASRFNICPGWNIDEFNKCMDAKLSDDEREVKKQEMERQKVEEEEEKEEEERKKQAKEAHKAAEVEEGTMEKTDINENVKRYLKLGLRRLTRTAEAS
jgi:hypothetical protein